MNKIPDGYVLLPNGEYGKPRRINAKFTTNEFRPDITNKIAIVEPDTRDGALAAKAHEGQAGTRFLVRVTSCRQRLIDEDNLCEKYIVDLCRYAAIIPDDKAEQCKIEVCQKKVKTKPEEKTVIEITK